jgi:serine protease inhibitor
MNSEQAFNQRRALLLLGALGLIVNSYKANGKDTSFFSTFQKDGLTEVVNSTNKFAFDFYAQIAVERGNLFFSPPSISAALAMTAAGAEGETANQLFAVLHSTADRKSWLSNLGKLSKSLNTQSSEVVLNMVNRIWGEKSFLFKKDYLELLQQNFAAPLVKLNFFDSPEASRLTINNWISDETNNRINKIMSEGSIDSSTKIVLTNAIYFKAIWKYPFDPTRTIESPFTVFPGVFVKVPLMELNQSLPYMEDQDVQVLELPYKSDNLSMVVILPKKTNDILQVEKNLSPVILSQWYPSWPIQK